MNPETQTNQSAITTDAINDAFSASEAEVLGFGVRLQRWLDLVRLTERPLFTTPDYVHPLDKLSDKIDEVSAKLDKIEAMVAKA